MSRQWQLQSVDQLPQLTRRNVLTSSAACHRFHRGLKRKPVAFIKKLRTAKKTAGPHAKPEPVRTHLRNMIIVPEMIGSIVGVYNGKTFNQVWQLMVMTGQLTCACPKFEASASGGVRALLAWKACRAFPDHGSSPDLCKLACRSRSSPT